MNFHPVITVDGPSGSGKGTLCLTLAKTLKWNILNSGILYRALAVLALLRKISFSQEKDLVYLANQLNTHLTFNLNKLVFSLKEKNITKKLYEENIANIASKIAIFPKVRKTLNDIQRTFKEPPGLIADGRDMGTVVFPDAILKIFLYASANVRAKRRMKQLKKSYSKFFHIYSMIKDRDYRDYYRIESPLVPAKDALLIDSTNLSVQEVVSIVLLNLNKVFPRFY